MSRRPKLHPSALEGRERAEYAIGKRGTLTLQADARPCLLITGDGARSSADGWPGHLSIYADLDDEAMRASLRAFASEIIAVLDAVEGKGGRK